MFFMVKRLFLILSILSIPVKITNFCNIKLKAPNLTPEHK